MKGFEINYTIIEEGREHPRTLTVYKRSKQAAIKHLKQRLAEMQTNYYEITGINPVNS